MSEPEKREYTDTTSVSSQRRSRTYRFSEKIYIMKTNKFESNGTEGMLDVILACTLIFILLTALIQVDRGKSQEVMLPDIDLSKSQKTAPGKNLVKKNIISIKFTEGKPEIFFDNKKVTQEDLNRELKNMEGVGHVALRRDQELPCKWEDQVILQCRNAGIERVAIVVSELDH